MKLALALFSATLAAAPAMAQNTPTPAPRAPAPQTTGSEQGQQGGTGTQTNPANREICRRINTTGSRLGGSQRVCKTEAEWRAWERQQD